MIRLNNIWPTPRRVEIAKGIRAGQPVEPIWELDTFRWRDDDGDESSTGATFAAAEVTNLTGVDVSSDVDFRLRIGLDQTDAAATANAADPDIVPRLEAKLNSGGTWALVPNDAAGTYVEMDSGSGLSDGTATTDHGLTLDHAFTSGGTQEENSSDAGTITLTAETQTSYINEWAVTLLSGGLADADVVFFRVTDAGTLLDNYIHGDASDTNPITITVTVPAGTAWDQDSFQAGNDDGSESAYNFKRTANSDWTQRTDSRFLLRFLVQETGGGTDPLTLQLQYNKLSGGWNNVDAGSSNVIMEASGNLTEGGDTTQRLGAGSFLANNNWVDDNDGLTAASANFAGNDEAEAVFSIYVVDADVADGNTIELRVIESPATPLDTYTNTPILTVQKEGNEEISDSLTLTESQQRDVVNMRSLLDGLTLSETLTRPSVFVRTLLRAAGGAGTITSGNESENDTATAQVTTLDLTHTVESGTNRAIVISVGNERNPPTTVTSIVIDPGGGDQASFVKADGDTIGAAISNFGDIWYLLDTDIPSAAAYTIRVTVGGGSSISAAAINLFGVDQAVPEATNTNTAASTDTISTQVTTLTDGAWIMEATVNGQSLTIAPQSGQLELTEIAEGGHNMSLCRKEIASAGLQTHQQDMSASANRLVQVLASFAPAAAGSGLTDTLVRTGVFTRAPSDSLTLTDNLTKQLVLTRLISDALTLTDTLIAVNESVSETITVTLKDALTLVDTLIRDGANFNRELSEALTLTENFIQTAIYDRTLSDSFTLTENLDRFFIGDRQLNDSLTLAENLKRTLVLTRFISDDFTLADSILRGVFKGTILSDNLTLTENLVRAGIFTRDIDDNLTLTENLDAISSSAPPSAEIGKHWRWWLWQALRRQKPHMDSDQLWG